MSRSMKDFEADSALYGANAPFIEQLFQDYCEGKTVPCEWKALFEKYDDGNRSSFNSTIHSTTQPSQGHQVSISEHQLRVQDLIQAYRIDGHLQADINPLEKPKFVPQLQLSYHQLEKINPKEKFYSRDLIGPKMMSLEDIWQALNQSYCSSIGVEYMHISNLEQRKWIQQRLEGTRSQIQGVSAAQKREIYERIVAAEGMEKYLGAKYPGAKRFSLEGGDSLIVLLDEIIDRLGYLGTKEIVLAMAHRGRLNALINILGKSPKELFDEFEGKNPLEIGSGDVKYHQGFSSDIKTSGGEVHLALAFNPSHLEIVGPVAQGSVAARSAKKNDHDNKFVAPIIVHGDSAFAGQGVVLEMLNMSKTRGYGVGGTVHIVVNNQVGFTTSHKIDTRSTLYCTDVAKMIDSPIFHVNADDPEAVWHVAQLAVDYRFAFGQDVIIDLVCYRRHGHNEADEPAVTQPSMYQFIRSHQTVVKRYAQKLIEQGVLSQTDSDSIVKTNRQRLEQGQKVAFNALPELRGRFTFDWTPYLDRSAFENDVDTSCNKHVFQEIGKQLSQIAFGITLHSRVQKIYEDRQRMILEEKPFDWGAAENLAYATLLADGFNIRLSGQDSGRGTFFHRHCRVRCQNTDQELTPLQSLQTNKGTFTVVDSLLSEEAVMAFEYGYAATDPQTLVIWEAQFGDFANGAQVVIDQFISSGEQKWSRYSGLTLLLPHGYEGQGPEHSSARLERYLQLCAQHNMDVCYPTTPAQIYHLLRRQMHRAVRRPLVVMTPKSILRHKLAISSFDELAKGSFQKILPSEIEQEDRDVKRVLLCSGKIYYELYEFAQKNQITGVAIVRLEQLYPFAHDELSSYLNQFSNLQEVFWVQEEPRNQGAWHPQRHNMLKALPSGVPLDYAGRADSAAPACGYPALHKQEQSKLIEEAFEGYFSKPS